MVKSLSLVFLGVVVGMLVLVLAAEGQTRKSEEEHGGNLIFEKFDPTNKVKEIKNHVLFSHVDHLDAGYECQDCHNDKIFKKEKKIGINKFTMKDINRGNACGACHDGVTRDQKGNRIFRPTKNCSRCHSAKWRKSSLRK